MDGPFLFTQAFGDLPVPLKSAPYCAIYVMLLLMFLTLLGSNSRGRSSRSGLAAEDLTEQNGVVSLHYKLRCAGRERCCSGRYDVMQLKIKRTEAGDDNQYFRFVVKKANTYYNKLDIILSTVGIIRAAYLNSEAV